MKFLIHTIAELEPVCKEILRLSDSCTVFAFYGNLGSGKTTLIQEICKHLGMPGGVTSPTYSIINEYPGQGKPVYHIDLFRLKSVEEAANIGLEEYLYSGNLCFIEWPDHYENLLPDKHIKIFIRKLENESRSIEIIKK